MFEKYTMLGLSISHITARTAELLRENAINDIIAYTKADNGMLFGWFIYVPGYVEDENSEIWTDAPQELRKLLAFARKHGADWLMLDEDAVVSDELPVFEW